MSLFHQILLCLASQGLQKRPQPHVDRLPTVSFWAVYNLPVRVLDRLHELFCALAIQAVAVEQPRQALKMIQDMLQGILFQHFDAQLSVCPSFLLKMHPDLRVVLMLFFLVDLSRTSKDDADRRPDLESVSNNREIDRAESLDAVCRASGDSDVALLCLCRAGEGDLALEVQRPWNLVDVHPPLDGDHASAEDVLQLQPDEPPDRMIHGLRRHSPLVLPPP